MRTGSRTPRAAARGRARGFTLLEVILALTIFAGAMAVLGELARYGLQNAAIARDLAQSQLLCEGKLGEITCGVTAPATVSAAPCDDSPDWTYSIQINSPDVTGLIGVQVTVERPGSLGSSFTLTRWMPDPDNATTSTSNSSSSSSSSSSGTNSSSSSSGANSSGTSSTGGSK